MAAVSKCYSRVVVVHVVGSTRVSIWPQPQARVNGGRRGLLEVVEMGTTIVPPRAPPLLPVRVLVAPKRLRRDELLAAEGAREEPRADDDAAAACITTRGAWRRAGAQRQ